MWYFVCIINLAEKSKILNLFSTLYLTRLLKETIVTVKADSSISCHSTSPLPPPVFKSNKVTPTEDMPVGTKNGMVNGTFETLDELAVQTTEADFESDNDASKISELMNVSSASEEYELRNESEIMNLKTDVSFKVEKA